MIKKNTGYKKIKNIREIIIESIECEPGTEGCTADPDTCPNSPDVCDKKLSMFGYYDDTIKESMEETLSKSLDELTNTFVASAKKWETVVYPALFCFVLLSAYGFYLIFSLTKDISILTHEMVSISKSMTSISSDVHNMNIVMQAQSVHIGEMNKHMRNVSISVNQMRYDISVMNSTVSRPMNFMNSFMPW
ncbi:hypothetical protein MNBD_GAMMA10-1284 [hydrothermal vent metagenome]|uniref:Uncharacterized protein n=1 Tax=hydrothermal vent metagenome TaxID=652676 RepID=A0A3B0Y9C6_9ZZZZ